MSSGQRKIVIFTGLAVGLMAGSFSLMSWSHANEIAGVTSALLSVIGVAVTIWFSLTPNPRLGIRVSSTGKASTVANGKANTGFFGARSASTSVSVTVENTGDAEADSGEANSGIRFQ